MFFSFNIFAQEENNSNILNNQEQQTVSNSDDFENNANYFNVTESITDVNEKSPSMVGVIIKIIVFLALVIAAIYALMLFFKKKNNTTKSSDDFLRRVSSLNLAPGKSIEIVTLIDKGYLLGVTESNINLISEIQDKELIQALNLNFDKNENVKKPMNFADVLEMFTKKGSKTNSNIYSEAENRVNNINNQKEF